MAHAFYMDVHVPGPVTKGLKRRGLDVLTARQDGQHLAADETLLLRATTLGRVFFTQDQDFLGIAAAWQRAGTPFSGVIFAPQRGIGIGEVIDELELIGHCMQDEEVRDRVVFLPL